MSDDQESAEAPASGADRRPKEFAVLRFKVNAVNLGPDYPPTAVSAEIGRVAIAAARVDQEYALLLHALHAARRADWNFATPQVAEQASAR